MNIEVDRREGFASKFTYYYGHDSHVLKLSSLIEFTLSCATYTVSHTHASAHAHHTHTHTHTHSIMHLVWRPLSSHSKAVDNI